MTDDIAVPELSASVRIPPSERPGGMASLNEVRHVLQVQLATVSAVFDGIHGSLLYAGRQLFAHQSNEAAGLVLNHAFNDFREFLEALEKGEGRQAARTARSLFEHLVHYCHVMSQPEAADRYLAHRAVTAHLLSRLTGFLSTLSGRSLIQERRRLELLGRGSKPDYDAAVNLYGKRFPLGWSDLNLNSAAERFGYADRYDVYRLLSQVVHGSSGGVLGSYADIKSAKVHRIGPSLELAALSYGEGMAFFRDLIQEVQSRTAIDMSFLLDQIRAAQALWPQYQETMARVDKDLWPSSPPPALMALMALYPSGGVRWYLYEPLMELIAPAHPPEDEHNHRDRFHDHVQTQLGGRLPVTTNGGPLTVILEGVQADAVMPAKWVPATAIMLAKPQYFLGQQLLP